MKDVTDEWTAVHGSEEAKGKLFAAMAKAQQKYKEPQATARNPHLKRAYKDTEDVVSAALPALNAQAIAVFQPPALAREPSEQIAVRTVIGHEGGAYIESHAEMTVGQMKGLHRGQMEGASYTYLARYSFSLACRAGVAGEDLDSAPREDDEAEPAGELAALLPKVLGAKSREELAALYKATQTATGKRSERQAVFDAIDQQATRLGLQKKGAA